MAYTDYRKGAGKGFNPIQVSDGNVNRILEEGNRVANVLSKQAQIEKANRDKYLSQVKENQRAEANQRQANFNLQSDQAEITKASMRQAFEIEKQNRENKFKSDTNVLKKLGALSDKAVELYNKADQAMFDADYQDELTKILLEGPDLEQQAEFLDLKGQSEVLDEENQVISDGLEATGADPLTVERSRNVTRGRQFARDQAASSFAANMFPLYLERAFAEDSTTEINIPGVGTVTPQQAATMGSDVQAAVVYSLVPEYLKEKGLYGMNPQLLTPALMQMRETSNKFIGNVRKEEAATIATERAETARATVAEIPTPDNIFAMQRTLQRSGMTRTESIDETFKYLYETINPATGDYLFSDSVIEQFESSTFPGKTKSIARDFPGRVAAARQNRQTAKNSAWQTAENTRNIRMKTDEDKATKTLLQLASQNKLNEATVNELQRKFVTAYGKPSEAIKNIGATLTIEASNKQGWDAQLEKMALAGYLTPEILEQIPNMQLREKYAQAAEANEKLFKNPASKEFEKAITKEVKGLMGVMSPDEPLGIIPQAVASRLIQRHRQLTQEIYAEGGGATTQLQAAEQAALKVREEFQKGQKDESSPYYFDLAQKTFTRIADSRAFADPMTRVANVRVAVGTGGLDALSQEDNKGLVYTKPELEKIERDYNKPGFTIPLFAMKLAKEFGTDPMAIINAQRKAQGMEALPPTPAFAVFNNDVAPEVRSLTFTGNSPNRSIRSLSTIAQYQPEIVPNGYGNAVQQAATSNGIDPGILAGLLEQESNWKVGAVSKAGAKGLGQFMPDTAAEWGVNVNDPISSINGAAKYLAYLRDYFNGDMRLAIYAYNGGMGNIERYGGPIPGSRENQEYYGNVIRKASKYGYKGAWSQSASMRPQMAYVTGNIGPTSTGPHLDVKRSDGQRFEATALDEYVEIEDPQHGRVPLSRVGVTADFDNHLNRGSHGIDYGTASGSAVYVKNGAQVIGSTPTEHGDMVTIQLPDGYRYTFLHGTTG